MIESWLIIPGHVLYEVSNLGSVRRAKSLRQLKPWKNPSGHLVVKLCDCGSISNRLVHRLVLSAFIGPCPNGMECCHNDGIPQNNKLSNLRWDTPLSNRRDKVRHGGMPRGEAHARCKLKDSDVFDIRELSVLGVSNTFISRLFNISDRYVRQLVLKEYRV